MSLNLVYLDIETTPTLGLAYQKYDATILKVKEESYMLSFCFMWDGKPVKGYSLADFPAFKKDTHNDYELVAMLWQVLDKADIVVAHNGDNFDIKKANSFFMRHGMTPPSPYKSIDTLKIARRNFKFFSNKLDDLGNYLGVGRKIHTEGSLWERCMDGEMKAFKEMLKYNKQDVLLLEKVYQKLKPWYSNHPHMKPEKGMDSCNVCGSNNIYKRGVWRLVSGIKPKLQCQNCGHWFSGLLQKV